MASIALSLEYWVFLQYERGTVMVQIAVYECKIMCYGMIGNIPLASAEAGQPVQT